MVPGLSVVLLPAFASPVSATGNGGSAAHTMTISGDSVPSDCSNGEGAGAIFLMGDVEGCLTFFPDSYICDELNGFDRYREWRTEAFVGELHEVRIAAKIHP